MDHTNIFANYELERQSLDVLFQSECSKPIVLIQGESGLGKTALLRYCQKIVQDGIKNICFDLRSSGSSTIEEIFSRSVGDLDLTKMPKFKKQVSRLEGKSPEIKIDKNWLLGFNNKISVVLQSENQDEREYRNAALLDAFFSDISEYKAMIIFLFDNFDKAPQEVQEWLYGPFLSRLIRTKSARVVITGQKIPDKNNIEWGEKCTSHILRGVMDAKYWIPVMKAMKRKLDEKDPELVLKGLCLGLKGIPGQIISILEVQPLEESQDAS